MRICFICSNWVTINQKVKKGTEIMAYNLINGIKHALNSNKDKLVTYASGDSTFPTETKSISDLAISNNESIHPNYAKRFEIALVAEAISQCDQFDLYHVNIGNGASVLPFALFCHKPIIITLHLTLEDTGLQKFISLYNKQKNIHFISISNAQRSAFPTLNYYKTIKHGIDIHKFSFNLKGAKEILWAGRAEPEKGLDEVITVVKRTKKNAKLFPIFKSKRINWLEKQVIIPRNKILPRVKIKTNFSINRDQLISQYQSAKLFLNPIKWEEPFGMTMIESMSCGTPVVAYARGSVPEIVKDGETGFIVNPSDNDIRGNFIIKKTGFEGLVEAVERIYSLPKEKYQAMRRAARRHVEKNFTIKRMVDQYVEVYRKLIKSPPRHSSSF